ncbi:hypothetical protein C1645_750707 [Glomus cerebriforme]|uniref:Uncharacterized protein n=1 Tax=Glomus cerebriforme TaxID=658196 RepID=A0A397TSU3_9GLOM|nr:hypothetical protein C1645_750707 [Glomus cerebriforme]
MKMTHSIFYQFNIFNTKKNIINMSDELKSLKSLRHQRDSEELKSLRHQRALELLETPGIREYFRKNFNFAALREWEEAGEPFEEDEEILAYLEYKKSEARKNGAHSTNSGSANGVIEQRSVGTGLRSSVNGNEQNIGIMYGIHPNNNQKTGKAGPPTNSGTRRQSTTTTNKNDKCSGKKTRSNGISDPVNALNRNAQQSKNAKSLRSLHQEKFGN